MAEQFTSVDQYISTFPDDVQAILQKIRQTIREVLPDEAEEVISYNIPTFKMHGKYVIYFSGWKEHISLYPIPHDPELREALAPFMAGKGTLKFPIDKPLTYDLIAKTATALLHASETRNS